MREYTEGLEEYNWLHFLPRQGDIGDNYGAAFKGEQGIPGFPGVRVGDHN